MKFKSKIRRAGHSSVITVPADFIKHDSLKIGSEYEITVKKIGESS